MKKMTLLCLLLPFILNANDTIQMLLESNGTSTENFPIVGEPITLSGDKLMNRTYQMHKKEVFMAYASLDHESEASDYLEEIITRILTSDTTVETGVSIFPHLIFDDNRINGAFRPIDVNDKNMHKLQHKNDIINVKRLALDHCNQALNSTQMRIPVITAPQNLVDILLQVNGTNLSYTIHDGITFHCILAQHIRN